MPRKVNDVTFFFTFELTAPRFILKHSLHMHTYRSTPPLVRHTGQQNTVFMHTYRSIPILVWHTQVSLPGRHFQRRIPSINEAREGSMPSDYDDDVDALGERWRRMAQLRRLGS